MKDNMNLGLAEMIRLELKAKKKAYKKQLKNKVEVEPKTKESDINQKLVAFAYFIKGKSINPKNMDAVAKANGWESTNSGRKIYKLFNDLIKDEILVEDERERFTEKQIKTVKIVTG